ncbi:uncharacterized protein [Chironomus tepperi]|uniref:uncharacterized protein n=1 Tax=Chironomus tepperi TaxID=113505 RepID=UPI00391EE729
MSHKYVINYSLNENELIQNYLNLNPNIDNIQVLNIINTPSAQKGLELLSKVWFKTDILQKSNLFGINIKIDDVINEEFNEKPHFYELNFKESFLIGFQSTSGKHESMIYWKMLNCDKFYSLYIDDDESEDVSRFLMEFLVEEIRNGRSGVMENCRHKAKIQLHEIGDKDGINLLILATLKVLPNLVKNLLEKGFDADNAIDNAWNKYIDHLADINTRNDVNTIILNLLKANSRIPANFNYSIASLEVKAFIDMCESLHKDVDDNNFDDLKSKIESNSNLMYFYNQKNESLLAHSLKTKKFEIFTMLNKQISTGYHEDLDEVYENMKQMEIMENKKNKKNKEASKNYSRKLLNHHKANAFNFPDIHILVLKSKSKIGNNDNLSHKKWTLIAEAYETLNGNEYCKKIMKLAAKVKKLKIYFDFKHESTYYMDPRTGYDSKGIIYGNASIIIGAKYLTDDEQKSEVFGVLIHELCHLAVLTAFQNENFDPFPIGESELKTRYVEHVMTQCRQKVDSEKIIDNVFLLYIEEHHNSEMVVTVPQLMMMYIHDKEKLKELEDIFEELFKYSKEVVEPELERALNVLEQLEDDTKALKFNNLTDPMKAAIMHSKINFRGSKTTFYNLIKDNSEILQLLTPNDIKKYILEDIQIKIGEAFNPNFKYEIIEREFLVMDSESDEMNWKDFEKIQIGKGKTESDEMNKKNFEEIQEETKNVKIFILADHAGTGKTTTFIDFASKLSKSTKDAYILFINLRKNGKIFNKYTDESKCQTIQHVCQLLLEIVNPEEIEEEIFKKLFDEGKVILFLDGVDEVCPKYKKLILRIFELISQTNNQQWISTRPHYAKTLQKLLNIIPHKFKPYTKVEKENFIKNILQVNNVNDEQNKLATKIIEKIENLEGYSYESEIDNPLMIQIITELYIYNQVEIDNNNRIDIYTAMIEKQKEEVGDKVPISERDKDLTFSIWDVHRVLAIILIFDNSFERILGFKLDDLPIMKRWKKEKKNFTSDMIQRYGFVIVDLNSDKLDRSAIDFMHRTYAEYFIAKYMIDFMFDDDSMQNTEENKLKFKLLTAIFKRKGTFEVVIDFIISYVKSQSPERIDKSSFAKLLIENGNKMLNDFDDYYFYIQFIDTYFELIVCSSYLMDKIRNVDGYDNILKKLKFSLWKLSIFGLLIKLHGLNWHEHFNKSSEKLITDEEIESLRIEDPNIGDYEWSRDKNFMKYYDYIDKNCNLDEKKKIYLKNIFFGYGSQAQIWIISKIQKMFQNEEFIDRFMFEKKIDFNTVETTKFILDYIENVKNSDEHLMRQFLREDLPKKSYNSFFIGYLSMKSDILNLFKNLYLKYNISWEEFKDNFE